MPSTLFIKPTFGMLQFLDYFLPSLPFLWFGFFYSIAAGAGWFMGGFIYAIIAAYAHQVQHDNPDLVFWLKKPVHHLHHQGNTDWQIISRSSGSDQDLTPPEATRY